MEHEQVFEYLGERSYSIYLLHPVVIIFTKAYLIALYSKLEPHIGGCAFFACALMVVAVVLMLAEITYRTVEVPGIKLGRRVIERMRTKHGELQHS